MNELSGWDALADWLKPIAEFLQHQPELCLFLALAAGFWIGQKKLGPVQLGGVCGTLLVAMLLGQTGVQINPDVKSVFFAVFIFALGYAGGPQFFASLNLRGLRLGVLSLIEVILVLSLALSAMHLFNFDAGTTAGLVAGAATESAVIGTASEAISRLPVDGQMQHTLQANVATAYSLTYIFGLITIVIFSSQIAPLLLRANLAAEAGRLWESLGGNKLQKESGSMPAVPPLTGRIFSVAYVAGKTLSQAQDLLTENARIERVIRKKRRLDLNPDLKLKKRDLVMVLGLRAAVIKAEAIIGPEQPGGPGANLVVEQETFVVTKGKGAGQYLVDLEEQIEALSEDENHVHFVSIQRNDSNMPLVPHLALQQGDIVGLTGPPDEVSQAGGLIGKRLTQGHNTNFVYIGLGLVLGILIGRIVFPLGGINLSLGTGGGALLTGLIFGWLRFKRPEIPSTSPAALEMMKDLGLAAFVACIGLTSGREAVALVGQFGFILPVTGIVMVLTPALVSLIVGRFILKLEIPVLLGGIAGQQCSTPALNAVQAAAGNSTPLMGYTITYAISNVLLPLLGPIIVGLAFAQG